MSSVTGLLQFPHACHKRGAGVAGGKMFVGNMWFRGMCDDIQHDEHQTVNDAGRALPEKHVEALIAHGDEVHDSVAGGAAVVECA